MHCSVHRDEEDDDGDIDRRAEFNLLGQKMDYEKSSYYAITMSISRTLCGGHYELRVLQYNLSAVHNAAYCLSIIL